MIPLMAISLPESLQRIFGDAAPDFVDVVREIAAESRVSHGEIERLTREQQATPWSEQAEVNRDLRSRSDVRERDFAQISDQIREVREDIRQLDRKITNIDERFDRVYDRMLGQTRWMVGTIVIFGTPITILLTVAQFTP